MIIVSEIGNIVEQTGIIKFRYEIYTENKEKPLKSKLSTRDQTGEPTAIRQNSQKETEDNCMYVQEAFLRDNLSGKLVSICRCEGSDAKWRDHCICAMCAGGCVLDEKYPGWSDPANWDENPASVLF